MTFTISKESLPFRADKSISQITLSNERLTIVVHDYGARVHQLLTPDKNGTFENILLSVPVLSPSALSLLLHSPMLHVV